MSNPIAATVVDKLVTTNTTAASLVVGGASAVATTGTGGINAGAIVGNTSVADPTGTMATIRAGGLGLASQGAGDVLYATSATQLGRLNGSGILQLNGAGAPTVVGSASTGAYRLIGGTSGTSTAAAATNVATFAISGLTVLDTLYVDIQQSSLANNTAEPAIYNATDSVLILTATNNGSLVATGTFGRCGAFLGCDPATNTLVSATALIAQSAASGTTSTTTIAWSQISTFTTAWTGSWTLALRTGAGGVTAGGTYRYRISVYKILGQ